MLTLSANNTTEVAKAVTEPFFLLYIGTTTPIRISSRDAVTVLSNSWVSAYFDVGGIQYGEYGDNVASIRLHKDYRDTILTNNFYELLFVLYMMWGSGPYVDADAVKLITGYGDSSAIHRDYVDVTIASQDSRTAAAPRVHYSHQNIQPAGSKITLANTTITIDRVNS